MPLSRLDLIRAFGAACDVGSGAVFAGAGLSKAAGLPDWKELLEGPRVESDVPLTADLKADLPLMAEYILVEKRYSRDRLKQHILGALVEKGFTPTAAHLSLARLPVDPFWTTNYDPLIEISAPDALVVVSEDSALAIGSTRRTIIKMHGSITAGERPEWERDPVITRADYENYARDHQRIWALLQASYLSKTILFVGFSFADPNIEILQRLSRLHLTAASNRHMTIMRRPPEAKPNHRRAFDLRVRDLEESGIRVHQIDEHDELPKILSALERRTRPARLFISGSERDETNHLACCDALGIALADQTDWELCSLEGVTAWRTSRKVAAVRRAEKKYDPDKLQFFYRRKDEPPPPLDERVGTVVFTDQTREELIAELLDDSRALLAVGGGDRTREEIEIAAGFGAGVVPLPAAGGTAADYWEMHRANPPELGGQPTSPQAWARLGDSDVSVAARAAVELLKQAMFSGDVAT